LLVGRGRALDIILSGREVSGSEAAAIGLVDRLVAGDVVDEALQFAAQLARMPGEAVAAVIACVDAALSVRDRGMALEGEEVVRMFEVEETRQALAAFVDKRRNAEG
jgi:enoyl-CoA hydratase